MSKENSTSGSTPRQKPLPVWISKLVTSLQSYIDTNWYPPLLAILAGVDIFIIILPIDGILISSAMLRPKLWRRIALHTAIGFTIGCFILAWVTKNYGMDGLLYFFPNIQNEALWISTHNFFTAYGLYCVFGIAISPIAMQPAVILSALGPTGLLPLMLIVFVGRMIKYFLLAYISSHAPQLINKLYF